jgi:copper ion binding protein
MVELQVQGMSCNHCVSRVTQSVKELDRSAAVEVDLPSQKVRIESTAALDDIVDALAEAGYPVVGRPAA